MWGKVEVGGANTAFVLYLQWGMLLASCEEAEGEEGKVFYPVAGLVWNLKNALVIKNWQQQRRSTRTCAYFSIVSWGSSTNNINNFHHITLRCSSLVWHSLSALQSKHFTHTETHTKQKQTWITTSHLASWLGPLPDAKVADEPGQGQTHGQLPAHSPHVLNTIWYLQYSAPVLAQKTQMIADLQMESTELSSF